MGTLLQTLEDDESMIYQDNKTNTPQEYESLAIEIATNPKKLESIKKKLISNLPTAPLYNTKLFTQNLEEAYTKIYNRHHKGLHPDHIYVKNSK